MGRMDWASLLSAIAGAAIALSGTVLAEVRRDKGQRNRDRELDQWRTCVEFALALDAAHHAIREIARIDVPRSDRFEATNSAVHRAGIYAARERLLMSASPRLARAGEQAFLRLVEVRNLVRTGASLRSPDYHRAYHKLAEAIWSFRLNVRAEFGQQSLTPEALDRVDWSDLDRCAECAAAA
jgi:hypothetical protein